MISLLVGDAGPPPRRFVLVGGVPGSGKTTLLARFAARPAVRVIDPEADRARFVATLGRCLPYRRFRGLVHTLHYLRMLVAALWPRDVVLFVHDPATRPRRRELLARLVRMRGWDPALVYLDVSAETALTGQHTRGRVLNAASFDRHWARWSAQRPAVAAAAGGPLGAWSHVWLTNRESAPDLLEELSTPSPREVHVAG